MDECGSYAGENEYEKTLEEEKACNILNEEAQKGHGSLTSFQDRDIEFLLNSSVLIKPKEETQVQWR